MINISDLRTLCAPLSVLLLGAFAPAQASAEAFGPFNYRCFDVDATVGCDASQESPFVDGSFAYFYLEDFEDGVFDVPGISPQQGGILEGFGMFQDSVDEDDGIVDGVNSPLNKTFGIVDNIVTITLDFVPAELGGRLPTHVGLVLVNNFNDFTLTAFDASGNVVETVTGTTMFVANGSTLDDNFTGASHMPGIASVSIAGGGGGMEIDHVQYGFGCDTSAGADEDADGIADAIDNCLFTPNPDQRDTDGDGFGNFCDADLNDDGITNIIDLGLLRTVFFTNDANADFNGDGVVNAVDLGLFRQQFFQAPGPACTAPLVR